MNPNPPRGSRRSILGQASVIGVAGALVLTTGMLTASPGRAATTDPNPSPREVANGELSRRAATEGMVLLENDGLLPLRSSGTIAAFGTGSLHTVAGGTGSGQVSNRHTTTFVEGLTSAGYTVTTNKDYQSAVHDAYTKAVAASGTNLDYAAMDQPLTAETVRPTQATDTAVVVVTRNAGEGTDRKYRKGDYLLTDTELANLKLVAQTYPHVAVLLNVGGVMDTTFFKQVNAEVKDPSGGQALDALLLTSQPGQSAGDAMTDVLKGAATPSGKLADTWASKYSYYPAAATFAGADGQSQVENYTEGLYVGYRWFDSFYRTIDQTVPSDVVSYPFGWGDSYTSFSVGNVRVKATMDKVVVRARVTNTGRRYSGREVVQVYFSAPQNGLDKPYQELAGYAKTDELKPGQSQTVTITYRTTEMSSYDTAHARYVMDRGDYAIRVGTSSRDTHVAALLRLGRRTVTEKLSSQLVDDQQPSSELTSDPANFYTYRTESRELRTAPVTTLDKSGFVAADHRSRLDQHVSVTPSSVQWPLDGNKISSVPVYLDATQDNWEGTGAAYQPKLGEVVRHVTTSPSNTLYDVKTGRISMEQFVAGLPLEELSSIVEGSNRPGSTLAAVGAAGYTTNKYEKQGIPVMVLPDGPAGLRLTQKVTTSNPVTYQFATAWPIGTSLAQTWDPATVKAVGTAVGQEMAEFGATLWLAPGMNIHRDPLNGRNFEYYSEDPFVTGITGASMTLGVQSTPGVGVTVKHFVANNQETDRTTMNSVVSERALREIYLKGFEMVVRSAQPMALMTSYNYVNGTYASGNYDLNTDVLRGEWGFKGVVVTDWTAGPRTGAAKVLYSGNDLIMPGNNPGEVTGVLTQTPPPLDVSGLPVYNQSYSITGQRYYWTWNFGSLTLTPTGDQAFSRTVDKDSDLSAPQSVVSVINSINNATYQPHAPFASVDAAYQEVMSYLDPASPALTAEQKAAISVTDVVHQDPADQGTPVVSYTVTVRGTFPAAYPLRLGDLQRSVANILTVAMQSAPFAELARLQGVQGISVAPYSTQYPLVTYLTASTGRVRGR